MSLSRHLLLVEDSEIVAEALQLLLTAHGYRVTTAGTVADAIARAMADPPDVLLLDLTLPDGHGFDVLAHLRERDALPEATIALTGHEDLATQARCQAAGCREVLVKPVPARELLERVASLQAP